MASKLRTAAFAGLIIGVCAFVIAVAAGLLYEQAQRGRDRKLFPQIGRSTDIGGRMLNIYCSGAGQPAVIFESGAPWPTMSDPKMMWEHGAPRPGFSWVRIQAELAKITTACWYDRAGSGWSDLGPYPRDSASQARDLHALLEAARVSPPYVLVAESSATLDARVYAASFPGEVAGLVFVNGVHPDLLRKIRPDGGRTDALPEFVFHSQDEMAQLGNRVGLYRLGLPKRPTPAPLPDGITPSEWNTIWHLTRSAKARSALLQEIAAWERSTAEARAAGTLGDRPLIVLGGENAALPLKYRNVWTELQTDLARLSARGKLMALPESGEDLIYRAPHAIAEATRQIVEDIRPGKR
ncbi:MAG TPA: alpha/beta hydrolase [Bryobacteraceae bacterium]|nr:alpha/beta hydrolase [Bryobacteraceae bacterium]